MDPDVDQHLDADDVHAAVVRAVREQGVDVPLLLADTCEAISDLVFDGDADPDRDAMIGTLTRQAGVLQAIGINLDADA